MSVVNNSPPLDRLGMTLIVPKCVMVTLLAGSERRCRTIVPNIANNLIESSNLCQMTMNTEYNIN